MREEKAWDMLITFMSAIRVFTEMQSVHICSHLKKCVLGFHDPVFVTFTVLFISVNFKLNVC